MITGATIRPGDRDWGFDITPAITVRVQVGDESQECAFRRNSEYGHFYLLSLNLIPTTMPGRIAQAPVDSHLSITGFTLLHVSNVVAWPVVIDQGPDERLYDQDRNPAANRVVLLRQSGSDEACVTNDGAS